MAKKKANVKPKRKSKKPAPSFGRNCCGSSYAARPPKKKAAAFTTKSCRGKKK